MDNKQEIRLLAAKVAKGTTENGILCPLCQGGRHKERSLSITHRPDGVCLYICHRATCGQAGRIFGNGNIINGSSDTPTRSFNPRVWDGDTRALNDIERQRLEHDFGLTYRETNLHRLSVVSEGLYEGRLVVRILGPGGNLRGHIIRVIPGCDGQPKTLTYKAVDEPFAGWFQTETSQRNKIVLVEDCFSAMKVARQFVCVCLCGTHLTTDNLFELLKRTDNLVLALDKDATKIALMHQKKYRFLAPHMQVAVLNKDLKHEPDEEIRRRVNI